MERGRRAIAKWISRRLPYENRGYVEEDASGFDQRLFSLAPRRSRYLDGLWQDERYFKDIADTLRADLRLNLSVEPTNQAIARQIAACQSVAVHVRWFASPTDGHVGRNVGTRYYREAIEKVEAELGSPHYFVFSDDVTAAIEQLELPPGRFTPVAHNHGDEAAVFDFWLMSQCRHFITANSTFSWWAAWLGRPNGGMILMPIDLPRMQGALVWDGAKGWIAEAAPPGRHTAAIDMIEPR